MRPVLFWTLSVSALLWTTTSCYVGRPNAGEHHASGLSGAHLYQRYCSACHGVHGRGDGLPGGVLEPAARDFGAGRFSLVSTDNGMPTDADLDAVLLRGMPGSAMPSFAWLAAADRHKLVAQVRELAETAMAQERVERARTHGETLAQEVALQKVRDELRPGIPMVAPAELIASPATKRRGAELYARHCASCHDEQGTGRRPVAHGGTTLKVTWARDFTSGVMRGGSSRRALAHRILLGMPASGMPPTAIADPQDLAALVDHVRRLIMPGSQDRLVQRRATIRARRLDGTLPSRPDDDGWAHVPATSIALSPLNWHHHAILHAKVRAVHDGERITVLVSWRDATRNTPGLGQQGRGDGVALQFSDEDEPTFFGMGSKRAPVNIWYWRPHTFKQRAGLIDVVGRSPHKGVPDVPTYVAAPGVTRLSQRAESVVARGHKSAADFAAQDRGVAASPLWIDGGWRVVFQRKLTRSGRAEIQLASGTTVKVALALWNGSIDTAARQKSFTIWHRLQID